ncbi:hypothetical protein [Nonomuraea sp. NPDC050202]|uniref:hypothetical protein n=1 Tax=Nonomuraea sp. NPDC050202 TaxID=3155035 RepID=UPI003400495B
MTTPAGLDHRILVPASALSGPEPVPARPAGHTRRDRAADVALFLLAIGLTALGVVEGLGQHPAPVPFAVDAALGGLSCLGVWLRRRWPVGFAAVAVAFSVYSMSAAGVALIALFTVAAHRRVAVASPIVAGCVLVPFLTPLVRPDVPVTPWWQVLLGFACIAAVLAWGCSYEPGGSPCANGCAVEAGEPGHARAWPGERVTGQPVGVHATKQPVLRARVALDDHRVGVATPLRRSWTSSPCVPTARSRPAPCAATTRTARWTRPAPTRSTTPGSPPRTTRSNAAATLPAGTSGGVPRPSTTACSARPSG